MNKRYRLDLSFIGTEFAGWQIQENALSIQAVVEAVLHQLTQEKIRLHGASRTDAGVHAKQFVAHFDAETKLSCEKLQGGLNALLPGAISVLHLQEAEATFQARKDVVLKTYRYLIFNSPVREAFYENRAWHLTAELDISAMAQAAKLLEGEHDFSCFQGSDPEPRPTLRTLNRCMLTVNTLNDRPNTAPLARELWLKVQSKGFLKYMVRNIVGTLVEIGLHKRNAESMADLLQSKDRQQAGATAPPQGLYLWEIQY